VTEDIVGVIVTSAVALLLDDKGTVGISLFELEIWTSCDSEGKSGDSNMELSCIFKIIQVISFFKPSSKKFFLFCSKWRIVISIICINTVALIFNPLSIEITVVSGVTFRNNNLNG